MSRAELEPLPQLNYQSSEAFNWGCSTAGALELAFAMLAYTTETRPTDLVCRTFCAQVVACLDPAGFVVSHGDIALWLMIAFSTPTPPHANRVRRSCRHGPARNPLDSLMAEATMSTPNLNSARCRSLRVVPRQCGNWIIVTEQDDVVSAHITATEAELICLREGDELVVYDRYHRCHRLRRPAPRSAENPHRFARGGAPHRD